MPNPNDLLTWLSSPVLGNVVTGLVTVGVTGTTLYFARRVPSIDRNHSKRLALMEMTRKRLELQDQLLKIELAALENGSTVQEQAKARAHLAAQRIMSDADLAMKHLEWSTQISLAFRKRPHKLKRRAMNATTRLAYWFNVAMRWICFVEVMLLSLILAVGLLRVVFGRQRFLDVLAGY